MQCLGRLIIQGALLVSPYSHASDLSGLYADSGFAMMILDDNTAVMIVNDLQGESLFNDNVVVQPDGSFNLDNLGSNNDFSISGNVFNDSISLSIQGPKSRVLSGNKLSAAGPFSNEGGYFVGGYRGELCIEGNTASSAGSNIEGGLRAILSADGTLWLSDLGQLRLDSNGNIIDALDASLFRNFWSLGGALDPATDTISGGFSLGSYSCLQESWNITRVKALPQAIAGLNWFEESDAGDLTSTAQVPAGAAPLASISGVISAVEDIDMYRISITDPAQFSVTATSEGAAYLFDPAIALFDQSGRGVYSNDDAIIGDINPALPINQPDGPSAPGVYYLAIYDAANYPQDLEGLPIFNFFNWPYTEIVAPVTMGQQSPVSSWFVPVSRQMSVGYNLLLTGAHTSGAVLRSEDLIIDFGDIGIYAYKNNAGWQKLSKYSPDKILVGDIDGNGKDELVADFSSVFNKVLIRRDFGLWETWLPCCRNPNTINPLALGDVDGNGKEDIIVESVEGSNSKQLYAMLNGVDSFYPLLNLSKLSPDQLLIADLDGNGQDDLIADFGSSIGGVFVKVNLGGWVKLHNSSPETMAPGDLDGNGQMDLVIDFGSIGLWARMNGSSWRKLHNNSPDLVVTGDLDGNGADDVIATFGSTVGGLWQKLNLGGWSQLNPNAPDEVVTADVDGSGKDDVIAKFGSTIGGIFVKRNQGSWSKLHNFNPDSVAVGNLDGN